jgi:MYXO-CTERM domain-containing protein
MAIRSTSTAMPYDAIADPDGAGVSPVEIFDTLGTGDEYAGFDIVAGETLPGLYEVELSDAAIMDMEFAASMDEAFVISGKLDTYDPAAMAAFEFVFGLSDIVVDGMPTGMPVPKLIIETGPVPSPSGVAVFGLAGLVGLRRRR